MEVICPFAHGDGGSEERDMAYDVNPFSQYDDYSDDRFVLGREDELSSIEKAFKEGKRVVHIQGPCGVGKTTLAMMFIDRNKTHFPGGIFQARAYEAESIERLLGRTVPPLPPRASLLVVDDADTLDHEDLQRLGERLRKMPQLKALVIRRGRTTEVGEDEAVISLGGLTSEQAKQLLESHVPGVAPGDAQLLYELLLGNPTLTDMAGAALHQGLATWNDLLTKLHDFQYPGIVGTDGFPLKKDSVERKKIVVDVSGANEELLRILRGNPLLLRSLPPRKFEEIVAELLRKQGYEVTITPASKDGGFDMYAARKDGLGKFLYLVECKRYTPPHKVGVAVARSLYGVLHSRKASAGVIVTTSFFTRGAKDFQQENFYQLQLHDYIGIQDWLREYIE